MQPNLNDSDIDSLRTAIAALEGHRSALGDAVVELALAPLRTRLAALLRPVGLHRRQVAVLFVDVVGSTALAQVMQTEDTHDLLGSALRRMAAIVESHQGRVLRFTGDGVKAVFGMDEAREDDAERAVRAGLAMVAAGRELAADVQRLHGVPDFAVRVGVHTGDVALGAGVEADNTAVGAAVNIAARMEQSAPPGALRISHDTWSHVRGLFQVAVQPPLMVKGVDAPMTSYLVLSALDRSVAVVERGLQGLHTPMVGRDAELQRLLEATASTRQNRQLQALTVLSDAGVGKSRLLRELKAALAAADAPAGRPGHRILAVRAQADGLLRPWGLLSSLLAVQCGVADTDSADEARRKVEQGLAPCFAEHGQRQAHLLGQLAGLDFGHSPHVRGLDPRTLRDQAFAALRGYLRGLAAPGDALPLLLVEDLHWADDGSLDLLQHLVAHAAELPLTLVMTSRPELLLRRPDWGSAETRLPLSPLSAAQADTLAAALLQRLGPVPPQLGALIVGQAEGNPYYMEELVRRLIDDGVIATDGAQWTLHAERLARVQLPGTLVGLLQARLDALPASERLAARQASVIGHVFWDDALRALDDRAPQALPALQRADFVHENLRSDFADTTQRQFDHHLLHQVTYDTLLKSERLLGHAAAARWLAERTQGRDAEFLAMTGDHAERAGDTAQAIHCFEQAARDAGQRFANSVAANCLRRALALLGDSDPIRRLDLLNLQVEQADVVGDRATQEAAQQEMAALLLRHPDDHRQARQWFSMALLADRRSESAASERLARQSFELAERCGAARWAAMAQGQLAWLQLAHQACDGATRHLAIGLPWAARIEGEQQRMEVEAQLLTLSGMVLVMTDQVDRARETLTAVLSRGEALGKQRLQLGAMENLAVLESDLGRWPEAVAWAERGHQLALSIGARAMVTGALMNLAIAAEAQGDVAAALRLDGEALQVNREIGDRRVEAVSLRRLGKMHLDGGDAVQASQHFAQAQALHQALDDVLEASALEASVALCALRQGQADAALAAVNTQLGRLQGDLAQLRAAETIELRWLCAQVLDALGDDRVDTLLAQLSSDLRARALALGGQADCERLIQSRPLYRDIEAAHARRARPA